VDSGVVEGDTVTIFYDPMIAKLIVWDADRPRALARLREALAQCAIAGPKSNIEFLERLVRHPVFVEGRIDTSYLDRHLEEVLPPPLAPGDATLCAAGTAALLLDEATSLDQERDGTDPYSPWARADAWRLGHEGKRLECFRWCDHRYELAAHGHDGSYRIAFEGTEHRVEHARLEGGTLTGIFDGTGRRFLIDASAGGLSVHDGERRVRFERVPAYAFAASAPVVTDRVIAPMPGRIVAVRAQAGATVAEGDELVVMEAMKMELTLRAPRAGSILLVQAKVGEFVEADAVLVRMDESP